MSAANNYHEEEVLGKAYDARLMRRLMAYVKPYKSLLIAAVIALVVNSFFQTYVAFVTKSGIDDYIMVGDMDGFNRILLIFIGVIVVVFVTSYAQIYWTALLGQKVQHDIRREIFVHLQRLHLGYYDKNPVGRLVTRVTNDVNTLNEMFSSGVVTIIGDILLLALIVGAMFYLNWQLALITFIVVPVLIFVTFIFRARARDAYRMVRLKLARLNAFVQEHITGMTLVQLFTREKTTFDRFSDINLDLRKQHHRAVIYYAVFYPTVEIIGALSLGLLFYYGGARIIDSSLTYGELVAFIFLVEQFFRPIRDLSEKYNILQASMASSERIFDLIDAKPAIIEPTDPAASSEFKGKVELENLWFAYNDEDWVLRDVSFTVEPGEKVAIVGATGAGKTSLVSLLYRFYDYQRGAIKIDGQELKDLSLADHRSRLGLVLQDVFLFSGDYAGNVRLRDENISDEQVRQAMDRVGFTRFLKQSGDDIFTEVKERGATLSTGQKQLLSFARALAFDPKILILDEATSSVDTETEQLIQHALDELLKGRTSIVIAHRLSTIEKADKIVVLHHGQVREIGRHEELLKAEGIYHKLYLMQYKAQNGKRVVA